MAHLFTTRVTVVGGRSGTVRSEDGILDLPLAMPRELGGKGGATNPEQLFAAGCAACFENAVIHVTRARADKVADDAIEVVGEVGLIANRQQGFNLAVSLDVSVGGLDQAEAEAIVTAAHAVCPYSNAVKDNVDVRITVKIR